MRRSRPTAPPCTLEGEDAGVDLRFADSF